MINIYYQNVRGLRTKTSLFYRNICSSSYDIICLTETWLLNDIRDSELFDDRYIVWRRDRDYEKTKQSMGGGVLIAVRKELAAESRPDWCSNAEDVWVTLTLQCRKPCIRYKLHLCTVYICSQGTASLTTQLKTFSDQLADIVLSNQCDKFILLGDFNMPNITWTQLDEASHLAASNIQGSNQIDFFDSINLCNLSQYNYINNTNNRILDLIFCNSELTIARCYDKLLPEDNHHPALCVSAEFVQLHKLRPRPYTKYLYNLGDYDSIISKIDEIDWRQELSQKPLETAITYFYEILNELRNSYIPTKTITLSDKYPPWFKNSLIKILKEKFKFHSKYKTYGNHSDYQSFITLRDRAKLLEKEMFNHYIAIIEDSISKNPKAFWTYIKSKNQHNTYPSILIYGNNYSEKGEEICHMFSKYFHSTFLTDTYTDYSMNSFENTSAPADIGDIEVVQTEVFKLLQSLDVNKSAGPDNIPAVFIVKCAKSLTLPLSLLFMRSLSEGEVPKVWKSAYITPIHKKGPKNIVENYRPISKLCLFAKVLERIVYRQVYACLKHTFCLEQHGFLKGRSTTSNLVLCADYISNNMAEAGQVDVIYTDYSKCFDRIDHLQLLKKIQLVGIRGNLYRWFTSYIQNRSQTVALKGFTSRAMHISSGVPQGSILGPLLFNIFVNDISSCFIHSKILLYADDMKIMYPVNSFESTLHLQEDLHRFETYCDNNKLNLNVSKCYVCTYTRKPNPFIFDYKLRNLNLTRVHSIRDLGVIFDSKLTFKDHINSTIKKAFKSLSFMLRMSSDFSSIKTFKILYCSFVRSHLEYASQVWNPTYETYTMRIERLQGRFLRYLQFRSKCYIPNYIRRCQKFHILPLQERRRIADLAYLLNIANGLVDCPELLERIGLRIPYVSSRRPFSLHIPVAKTKYTQNCFLMRAGQSFNEASVQHNLDLFNTRSNKLKRVLAADFFLKTSI